MKDVNTLINNGIDVNKSLELFGDMELYNETLVDFLNSIDSKLNELKVNKENGDMANYAIYAHSIKSDSRYLGFTKLAEIAYQHELDGKANNYTKVCSDYDRFIEEVNKIICIVKQYISGEVVEKKEKEKTCDKTILVVDDSDIIRKFIQKIFSNTINVILATDGNEAITVINSNTSIDGILLDLNMPRCNGYEVLEFMKKNNYLNIIPVALITGEEDKNNISTAFSYGIIDALQKPFNETNVKSIVSKMLDLY